MMRLRLIDQGWTGDPEEVIDCLIVGGGPAGLMTAIYLSRFLRSCVVYDAAAGRVASIPHSRNLPGFPGGISGVAFLARLQAQLREYGGTVQSGEIDAIVALGDHFSATCELNILRARTVVLATGVLNRRPEMPDAMHDIGVARGLLRYCPICDGYEARRMNVAVLGGSGHGAEEAEFLRAYGAKVTLLAERSLDLGPTELAKLNQQGIDVAPSPVEQLRLGDCVEVRLANGLELQFDTLYPALGSSPRTRLATLLGAKLSKLGCVLTDAHQQTSVDGVYAVGDVVEGLDQISVAGQAAIAATAIHNLLRDRDSGLSSAIAGLYPARSVPPT
ncbi:NAD(P)/FAD-dependent oxidoreductase [Sphingomonas sp. S-NIH.Pt1_0416]|nr:NAD(P)/FAD-dependent oxidoreductase [Sphingomonas sp. S-NIH.Pt1_0416]